MNRIVFCLHNCFMRNMNYTHPSVIIVSPEISFIIQDGCFLTIWHINAAKLGYVPKLESADTGHREKKSIKYENLVKGHWNAKAPLQIVVSDMTILKNNGKQWEWTLLLDTFNNEIIAHSVSPIAGDNKPYYHCLDKLNSLAGKKEEQKPQVVFHTDQGAVYSSRAFCHAHEHYNILRSMSRGGTPTDNPIIEALNGWIKEELYLDYGLADADNLPELLNQYVYFFNHLRPSCLGLQKPSSVQDRTGLPVILPFLVSTFS